MKIMILGGCDSSGKIAAALAISLATKQTEVVAIDSLDDIDPNDGDILTCDDELTPNQRQLAVLGLPISCLTDKACAELPYKDNSFRGGSRGKGGKTKYKRG